MLPLYFRVGKRVFLSRIRSVMTVGRKIGRLATGAAAVPSIAMDGGESERVP